MRKELELLPECYKKINGQTRLCCASPGCRHYLGTVVEERTDVNLKLEPSYDWINSISPPIDQDFSTRDVALYGDRSWNNATFFLRLPGRRATQVTCNSTSVLAKAKQGKGIIFLSAFDLPVLVACKCGHAVHKIKTFPGMTRSLREFDALLREEI